MRHLRRWDWLVAPEYRAFAFPVVLCGFWSCLSRRVLGDMVVFAGSSFWGGPAPSIWCGVMGRAVACASAGLELFCLARTWWLWLGEQIITWHFSCGGFKGPYLRKCLLSLGWYGTGLDC